MCDYTQDYEDEPHGIVCAEIEGENVLIDVDEYMDCLLYTSPSPRDRTRSRMPSSA